MLRNSTWFQEQLYFLCSFRTIPGFLLALALFQAIAGAPLAIAQTYDVSADYSTTNNPAGPWSYGWVQTLNGSFTRLLFAKPFYSDNGVPLFAWLVSDSESPGVLKVIGNSTAISAGGAFNGPPGTVWFGPGDDGTSRNFGVIRFTVPAGGAGSYRLETAVRPVFDGAISADSDFHVTRNGQELFGQFLAANSGTGYTNTINLSAGDTIDFAVGRGADGTSYRTGLKIQARLINASPTCAPAANGLVSWWRGESNTLDSVDGNHGIAVGNLAYAPGKAGLGFVFNGSNANIKVPASSSLNAGATGSGITTEGWIKPATLALQPLWEWNNGLGTPGNIFGEGVTLFLSAGGTGNLYANVMDIAGNQHAVISPGGVISTGVFHHIASTYDKASGLATFYVNGVKVYQQNVGSFTPQTSYDFYLGHRPTSEQRRFTGQMDEVALYNRALSSNEIAAIYVASSAGKCPPPVTPPVTNCVTAPSGLVSSWKGESNTLDSVDGNDGMAVGSLGYGPGKVGLGFSLDALNGYGKIPAHSNLNVGTGPGLTLETWINPADVQQWHPILEWNNASGGPTGEGAHLWLSVSTGSAVSPGSLFANLPEATGQVNHVIASGPGVMQTGMWQHVAVTYDKASGLMRLYRNGSVVAQQDSGRFDPRTQAGYDLYLGYRPTPGSLVGYSGQMDEVSVYSRALSAGEIAAIYNAGSLGKCPPSPAPPTITQQPSSQSVFEGQNVTFSVVASGTSPLSYQWRNGTNNLAVANASSLILNNVQLNQGGVYSVVVSNASGTATSSNALLTVTPVTCVSTPAGLVSWWKGEGNTLDSADGNNGIAVGGLVYASGKTGQGFALSDASGAGVRVPARSNLNLGAGAGLTLETWINPADVQQWHPILEWNNASGGPTGEGAHLWLSVSTGSAVNPGSLFANLPEATAQVNHVIASGPGVMQTGMWQHVAVTYDKASGLMRLYRNGSVVAQQNSGRFDPRTQAGYDLYLGYRPTPGSLVGYSGQMDEVSVYNRALTSNEIAGIYNASSKGKCPPVPLLLGQGPNQTINCPVLPIFTPPTVVDKCDPNPRLTFTDSSLPGACPGTYRITRTWIATDICGGTSAPVSQTITVIDTTPPSLAGQGGNRTNRCGAIPIFAPPGATDNCDPNPTLSFADSTITGAGGRTITRTWLAVDQCGNTSAPVSQTITIQDSALPVLICSSNIVVEFTSQNGAVAIFNARAVSDCDSNVVIRCTPSSGSSFAIGTSQVRCAAADSSSNSALCSFTVTVLGARGVKDNVLAEMTSLAGGEQRQHHLDQAIDHLANSLEPALWLDQTHLASRHGGRAFQEEKETVKKLADLMKSKKNPYPDELLQTWIDRIVRADRLLASVATEDAVAAGLSQKQIGQAQADLARGDSDAAGGKPETAVEHYRQAWMHAVRGNLPKTIHLVNGHPHLEILAEPGQAYVIQTSTNLVDWITLAMPVADGEGVIVFDDARMGDSPVRFYRVSAP